MIYARSKPKPGTLSLSGVRAQYSFFKKNALTPDIFHFLTEFQPSKNVLISDK